MLGGQRGILTSLPPTTSLFSLEFSLHFRENTNCGWKRNTSFPPSFSSSFLSNQTLDNTHFLSTFLLSPLFLPLFSPNKHTLRVDNKEKLVCFFLCTNLNLHACHKIPKGQYFAFELSFVNEPYLKWYFLSHGWKVKSWVSCHASLLVCSQSTPLPPTPPKKKTLETTYSFTLHMTAKNESPHP